VLICVDTSLKNVVVLDLQRDSKQRSWLVAIRLLRRLRGDVQRALVGPAPNTRCSGFFPGPPTRATIKKPADFRRRVQPWRAGLFVPGLLVLFVLFVA